MTFAWQGWKLSLPPTWNPAKLHGDYARGYALLADSHAPRLGIRWSTPPRQFNAPEWARRALIGEIGQLAAQQAEPHEMEHWRAALLYTEPSPPGRDVWVAQSALSGRTLELVHPLHENEPSKLETLLDDLTDSAPQAELDWAVFDLSCRTPARWRLKSQQLNAGDLGLTLTGDAHRTTIRQIAVAQLALKRMSIDRWLAEQARRLGPRFKITGETETITLTAHDGRLLEGLACNLRRKRRWIWNAGCQPHWRLMALHDPQRDRLVMIDATDPAHGEELAKSVGCLHQEAAV